MRVKRWILGLLAAGAVVAGCDRPKPQGQGGVSTTTTRPAVVINTAPTTSPAATQPTTSALLVGGKVLSFPRARVVVQQSEPNVVLLLFSDDPREAIQPDYKGNRYYFEIKLDIDDLAHLPGSEWHYKGRSIEREDSPVGIFLEGDRVQLQPYDVRLHFASSGPQVRMLMQGQFLQYETRDELPPKPLWVQGELTAELEMRKGKAR